MAGSPAPAQEIRPPIVGFLSTASESRFAHLKAAFEEGLRETDIGRNARVEYLWADDRLERLPFLATELLSHRVSVIVASGGLQSALAAQRATSSIPVVFTGASDPVGVGLVESLGRPGRNVTGVDALTGYLDPKRLQILQEIAPDARVFGVLLQPSRPDADTQSSSVEAAAKALGMKLVVGSAASETEFEAAFHDMAAKGVSALLVSADPLFNSQRGRLIALADKHRLPAIYTDREAVAAGGLVSYGASLAFAYQQAGAYAGRILGGAAPADLPVLQPTKFELAINLRTARVLGLTIPPTLLALADEVIE